MAYSVDWIGKIITIPQNDLVFVSGSMYTLDMSAVHGEVRRLEGSTVDGLWADQIIAFSPTVVLSGIPKPATIEFINNYMVRFGGLDYNCILTGYDTNLLDVLIPGNGISVLANNSVGKQTVTTGGGTTAEEIWKHSSALTVSKFIGLK